MCLQDVRGTSRETDEEQVFYKVMLQRDGHYITPVRRQPLEIGETYRAAPDGPKWHGNGIVSARGESYESGFHLLTSAEDARQIAQSAIRFRLRTRNSLQPVVMEVSARGIHTVGMDWDCLTVVAREITPLRVLEPNGESPDDDYAEPQGMPVVR